MAHFNRVETYPSTGFPERQWDGSPEGPGSSIHDAFLRSARPVVELYSEALNRMDLHGPRSTLSLSVAGPIDADGDVRVLVWQKQPEMLPEMGFVYLTDAVRRLDARGRAALVLDVLEAGVRTLAPARDWDLAGLESCRAHVEDSDFVYRWATPWKTSPGRKHQARATYTIGAIDGFGRARLEVRRRADDELVATSDEALAHCTSAGLKRSATSLRWSGPEAVGLTPYWGFGGRLGGAVEAIRDDRGWQTKVRNDVSVRQPGGDGLEEEARTPCPRVVGALSLTE